MSIFVIFFACVTLHLEINKVLSSLSDLQLNMQKLVQQKVLTTLSKFAWEKIFSGFYLPNDLQMAGITQKNEKLAKNAN